MFNTLSGRFLVLTIVFVMLAEIFIFIPSISRFRVEFLSARIERAQIASLALLADDMLSLELEEELLENAAVFNVVLRRNATRELVLSSELPKPVHETFDLRSATIWDLISDALNRLADPELRVIRVIGEPRLMGGSLIEVTLQTQDLRIAMINYGLRVFILSAAMIACGLSARLSIWVINTWGANPSRLLMAIYFLSAFSSCFMQVIVVFSLDLI